MASKKIIFASSHPYSSAIRLGSSFLAEAMNRRGWSVLYIDQPTSLFHLVHPRSRERSIHKINRILGRRHIADSRPGTMTEGISVLSNITLLPHVDFRPFGGTFTLNNWHKVTFPPLAATVRARGFADAAAFLFDSPVFYPLAKDLRIPTIYRYADRLRHMDGITHSMLLMQKRVFAEASLVAYTSEALRSDIVGRSGPSFDLPNGVDIAAFGTDVPEPAELAGITRPRVVYAGAFERWFDSEIFEFGARQRPSVSFVLLGDASALPSGLLNLPNVFPIGVVPHGRVPHFLHYSDLGIIPFDIAGMRDLVKAINPLKLYEYCAAGLPVVAYNGPEFVALGAPVRRYNSPEDYVRAIDQMLTDDTAVRRAERRSWAEAMSWDGRAAVIETALAVNGFSPGISLC